MAIADSERALYSTKMTKKPQKRTRETQYNVQIETANEKGVAQMGLSTSYLWHHDPKHLLFTLSRYKFAAKMLAGKKNVAEVGCGDAFGSRLIATNVYHLDGYDFDPVFIENASTINDAVPNMSFYIQDILKKGLPEVYDAIYSLDVLEHIPPAQEKKFMKNMVTSLTPGGVCIAGTPNITSQTYASEQSKLGHINCKSHDELKKLFEKYFSTVFMFSMNDEVVHTGYGPMAHYLFAVGIGVK